MKVIREQLIEAAKAITYFKPKYNMWAVNKKTSFFDPLFLLIFWIADLRIVSAIFWQSACYVYAIYAETGSKKASGSVA